jgi:hypothetical protein
MWVALSDVRTGLLFISVIAAWPRQRSHIYRIWILETILLHEFQYYFCDDHYSLIFGLCPIELCHDLPKYRCDYFEHVVQRRAVCIRSLNCVTWYLLLVLSRERVCTPMQLEGGWCCCYCSVLLCSTAAKDSPELVWLEESTLPVVALGALRDFLLRVSSLACLQPW